MRYIIKTEQVNFYFYFYYFRFFFFCQCPITEVMACMPLIILHRGMLCRRIYIYFFGKLIGKIFINKEVILHR